VPSHRIHFEEEWPLSITGLTLFYLLPLAAIQMHVSSRPFVLRQLDHLENGLGRQNCSGDSAALLCADSDRSFPYLFRDTGNNNALAFAHVRLASLPARACRLLGWGLFP
jgi:hypothetical protein